MLGFCLVAISTLLPETRRSQSYKCKGLRKIDMRIGSQVD
jgi:hypothetical protein